MSRTDREQFLHSFRREVNDCMRLLNTDTTAVARDILTRFEVLRRDLCYAERGQLISHQEYVDISTPFITMERLISQVADERLLRSGESVHFHSVRISYSQRGSPKYNITRAQLEFPVACRFIEKSIADIMHVSPKTVCRRIREFGFSEVNTFSDITDEDLDERVKSVISNNRKIGANSIVTRLHNNGMKVQRERVREAVRRVDPAGVALRSRKVLKRRAYRVEGPNSLWHLDGNHKLIRWRIVVHAAVDGYSRMIMYMKAFTNYKRLVRHS